MITLVYFNEIIVTVSALPDKTKLTQILKLRIQHSTSKMKKIKSIKSLELYLLNLTLF